MTMSIGDDIGKRIKALGSQLGAAQKKTEEKRKFRHIPEIIMNKGELDLIDREIAEDYVEHIPLPPGFSPNREGFKQFVVMLRTAFPDLHYDVDHLTSNDLIGENQKVVHRLTAHGTHTGPWGPIPASGKCMTWTEIHFGLYVQDMLVEHWGNIDSLGIMQQMGVIPGWVEKGSVPPTPQTSGKVVTTYQQNSAMVRRYMRELWNKGKLEVADELVHPQGVSASLPYMPVGPEGVKLNVTTYRSAFPNLYILIQDILAEENVVAIRFTMLGTHQGTFMGIPPTGKEFEVDGCCIFSFGDGQIIEHWQETDLMGLFVQLGVGVGG
ncbi:MAG: ester cyclase [Anaerolineaceae bacterium]